MDKKKEIKRIIHEGTREEQRALYGFNSSTLNEKILKKFNIWARYFAFNYFSSEDAEFHKDIDKYNLKCYREEFTFVDVAFRGASKSSRTKLMLAFLVANDEDHYRRYIRILSQDMDNCRQFVTDIYNLLIQPRARLLYPEIFQKTENKREETMSSFTTATGIKVKSDTVGVNQRGAIQEDARPDLIIFDDVESSKSLRSAVNTYTIGLNIEEARTGLAVGGSCIYLCNYISEGGNVHRIIQKYKNTENGKVLIVPIMDEEGNPTWSRYPLAKIDQMKKEDIDFEGERMCCPSAGMSVFFDRNKLNEQKTIEPIEINNGFKIYKKYQDGHRYASGHDVSGGMGLDSSTSVFIDFTCFPAEVVATYVNNTIKPDLLAYELTRQSRLYGNCLIAPECNNDMGGILITTLKTIKGIQIYRREIKQTNIYDKKPTEYGWRTTKATKYHMLDNLANALFMGEIIINDNDLLDELKYYTRDNVMDRDVDPRLATKHFDLLIALAIAWQMREYRYIINDNNSAVKIYAPKIDRLT